MLSLARINYRHLLPDIALITISMYSSLYLRVGDELWHNYFPIINRYFFLFLLIRVSTLIGLGTYQIIWRYFSAQDVLKLVRAVVLSSVVLIAVTYMIQLGQLPRAVFVIDTLLLTSMMMGIRLGRRMVHEWSFARSGKGTGRVTLIYGAGENGRALVERYRKDTSLGFMLVGFVDDDPAKIGRTINGVRVLGSRADLPELLRNNRVQEFVISMRDLQGSIMREVVQAARSAGIRPRLMKSESVTVSGDMTRSIELNDLLSRPERLVNLKGAQEIIRGKRILVTGAGGSIGSELARQILSFKPSRLFLLDHSEFNLYQIDQELRGSPSDQGLVVPVLADIKDAQGLEALMKESQIEVIFHAAAYKHVHLVESNPFSSIVNNVLGTKNLVELAKKYQVEAFVLISTDKAVNPAGIMGSTKRVCEMLVAQAGLTTGKRYCAVRFGNVLGSSGSLIPLLQKQILNGEPVTITHEDMTRYFMLIPEAVSLVLKAATIARPGDISILKMGEPVKIVEIARSLITLLGKTEEDVPIVYTGLRPGEKMYEELYLSGNELMTEHPDILVLGGGDAFLNAGESETYLETKVDRIIRYAANGQREAVSELKDLVKSTYVDQQLHIS